MSEFGGGRQRLRSRAGGVVHLRRLAYGIVVLLALWFGGFLHYAAGLSQPAPEPEEHTDAIVVLTGGADRLDIGLELLINGMADRLLITGVDPKTTAEALQARSTAAPERFRCCVALGHEARDTRGNALEAAAWVQRLGLHSVRLVTASYHMPRSLLLFHEAMPKVQLLANPVFPDHVKLGRWWLFPGTTRLLATEFTKYLVTLVRVRLGGGPHPFTA